LEICDGGYAKDHPNYGKPYYKCELDSVCYHCKNYNYENDGRCSHYYEIEHLDEKLENLCCYSENLKNRIVDLQVDYEIKLAIKEGRYEEYKNDLYDDY
jgi:queuine/archaeosine tRNA-ribosyltransferase